MTAKHVEAWKDVVGYEGLYSISSLGRVRKETDSTHLKRGAIIDPHTTPLYYRVALHHKGVRKLCHIHTLVAEAFIGKRPKGMWVNHKDLNKMNNNSLNLEYITPLENIKHSIRMGGHWRGSLIKGSKLKDVDVLEIRKLHATKKHTLKSLALRFNVAPQSISQIVNNITWTHIKLANLKD